MKMTSRMPLFVALLFLILSPKFLLAQESISKTPVPIATNDAATIVIPQSPPKASPSTTVPVLPSTPPVLTLPTKPSTPLLNSISDSFADGALFAAEFPVGQFRDMGSPTPEISRDQSLGGITPVPEPSSSGLLVIAAFTLLFGISIRKRDGLQHL